MSNGNLGLAAKRYPQRQKMSECKHHRGFPSVTVGKNVDRHFCAGALAGKMSVDIWAKPLPRHKCPHGWWAKAAGWVRQAGQALGPRAGLLGPGPGPPGPRVRPPGPFISGPWALGPSFLGPGPFIPRFVCIPRVWAHGPFIWPMAFHSSSWQPQGSFRSAAD